MADRATVRLQSRFLSSQNLVRRVYFESIQRSATVGSGPPRRSKNYRSEKGAPNGGPQPRKNWPRDMVQCADSTADYTDDESTRTERLSHSTDHREKSTEYRFRVHSVCCVVPCFREDRLCECSSTGGGVMADGSLHRRLGGPEPPGGRISIQRLRVSGTTLQASAHGVRGICSRTPYHEAGRDRTIITGAAASVIAICPCMGRKTWLRGHLRQGLI